MLPFEYFCTIHLKAKVNSHNEGLYLDIKSDFEKKIVQGLLINLQDDYAVNKFFATIKQSSLEEVRFLSRLSIFV